MRHPALQAPKAGRPGRGRPAGTPDQPCTLPAAITADDTTNVLTHDTTRYGSPRRRPEHAPECALRITSALMDDITTVIASNSVITRDIASRPPDAAGHPGPPGCG
jgi:hypothetical protein